MAFSRMPLEKEKVPAHQPLVPHLRGPPLGQATLAALPAALAPGTLEAQLLNFELVQAIHL